MLHCDLRVRWKVASDLRFRVAISEPKTPSFCGISGDLAPSTWKSLAIAIVRFWCAKLKSVSSEFGYSLHRQNYRPDFYQKNPRAHKNKIGTPPPPKPKIPPPSKTRNFMDMGFSCRTDAFFQASIKLAHPFPAPELRKKILRTRGFFWFYYFSNSSGNLGCRYDWTAGGPRDGNRWRKYRVVPREHPSRPLVYACFNRSGSKGALDFQGRRGNTSIVRWSLRPVIFGVDNKLLTLTLPENSLGNFWIAECLQYWLRWAKSRDSNRESLAIQKRAIRIAGVPAIWNCDSKRAIGDSF